MAEYIKNVSVFGDLKTVEGFWFQAKVDKCCTVVYWNDWIDLPSDAIYEYGQKKKESGLGLLFFTE